MINKLKKEINKILIKRLDKLKNKNLDVPNHKIIKAIGIYILCFLVSNISTTIGGLSFAVLGLLYVKNDVLPFVRNLEIKAIKKYLSLNQVSSQISKEPDKGLFSELNKTKENAKKYISNLYVNNISKFKSKFNLVTDNFGGKKEDNSYRMTSNKIIQDHVSLKEVEALKNSEKIKAKTKTK